MNDPAVLKDDALRFIAGFEMKNGRGPSQADVADGVFAGQDGLCKYVVQSLVIEGRLQVGKGSRQRKLHALQPMAIPRAPDGEPLHFVRAGGPAW